MGLARTVLGGLEQLEAEQRLGLERSDLHALRFQQQAPRQITAAYDPPKSSQSLEKGLEFHVGCLELR